MSSIASSRPVGVIGTGQFGSVIADLLAKKSDVLVYTRRAEKLRSIMASKSRIQATNELKEIAERCEVIFPIIPASAFPSLIDQLAPYLQPAHIIIHGIKGFCLRDESLRSTSSSISKDDILTISQIIEERSSVLRIGCISGPNIAEEIAQQLPAATIIASRYDEVIYEGQRLLKSAHFLVYGSTDIIGTELCGVLKNIIAIAAGLIDSLQLGNNAKALLISRGIVDIVQIGRLLGASPESFLGLAGIGDVITSCFSPSGRNFRVGKLLALHKSIKEAEEEIDSTAEGIRTVDIVARLAKKHKIRCLIAEILYKIMHKQMSIEEASQFLMKLPFAYDTYHHFSD